MTPVVVVGAGPTGLLLAGDLAAAGLAVTVLERRPAGISNLSRAFGVHVRTLEYLDARGLGDELAEIGQRVSELRLFGTVRIDISGTDARYPYMISTPQYEVERLLLRRAVEHGVEIRHESQVVGLAQDGSGVAVSVRGPAGPDTVRASWVVGADGAYSATRAALALPFPGRAVVKSVVLADVRLTDEPPRTVTVKGAPDAFGFLSPLDATTWRVGGWSRSHDDRPESEPVELDELRETFRLTFGTDFGMHDPTWLSRFHSEERQVPRYRVGRVLLAGDAAHVHSPAGGQGMNTGLQDAANLSWKLAAVLRHGAPESILDTYQAERHPVGRNAIRSSGQNLRLTMARSSVARARRALFSYAVERVPPLRRAVVGEVSGVGHRYPRPRGSHRLVGRRWGDLELVPGRLYEALRSGRFVLVAPKDVTAGCRDDRVEVRNWLDERRTTVLLRPDGHVAWAAEDGTWEAGLSAMARWVPERAPGGTE
ncbi:FAD-dependent oxidoreductase [Pseudonocardia endophytica]|uniref:2-polyprenyl-6-methoxyphenol hydroxylase-like FAD-dependent oxidoreductase n=1 Tax=Pseudonocardia endophytica TaxID=401976 RepID=A0A4R1HIL9_PSEEN|nr:FAD-dependent oxidoreductase [Pseudonocardia endophytica]TCK22097.1 2-polyprenyl-6-methoxyphenol hydroxylase-like FAD-dependent oxidoreductase [Pseudonocardia endophytica]